MLEINIMLHLFYINYMAEVREKIIITPQKEILFKSNTVSDDNVSKLTLQNVSSSKCIAFKIKTTAPKNYVVKPN